VGQRPSPTARVEGEFRKSAETRERILESAITCLFERGYPKLSIAAIAEGAGLTRAAAIYHFPNRESVLRALAEYLIDKRLLLYWNAVRDVPDDENQIARFVDIYWEQVDSPVFVAFVELTVAARTDPDLARILAPELARFDEERARYSRLIFSHEMRRNAGPRFETMRDVARFLIEGMAFAAATGPVAPERIAAIKDFVTAQMEASYQRGR